MSRKLDTFKIIEKRFGDSSSFKKQEQIGERAFNARKDPVNKYNFEENGSPVRIAKRDLNEDSYFERAPRKQRKYAREDVSFSNFILSAPLLTETLSSSDIPPELRKTF